MKGIFCVDLSKGKDNSEIEGLEFVVDNVPESQEEAIDRSNDLLEDVVESASLPKVLEFIKLVFELGAFCALLSVLNILFDELTLKQLYANSPLIVWFELVSLICFPVLLLISRRKSKQVFESDDTAVKISRAKSLGQTSYEMLDVPSDAVDADVFMMKYKLKNGELKPHSFGMFDSMNLEVKLFADDENLFIADTATKYAFPLAEIKGIRRTDKQISFPEWHKETEYNKGEYKQYKIKLNGYGIYFVKPYYALQISHNGEDYELYFPSYELNAFEHLTGLTATE